MNNDKNPLLSNATYDRLMSLALLLLPALATLYFTLGTIWGFPELEKVLGTVAGIEVFLGALLKISQIRYNNSEAKYDGKIFEVPTEGGATFVLQPNRTSAELAKKNEIVLKVISSE